MKAKTKFGEFLLRLRGAEGENQIRMCAKLGVTPAVMSHVESGTRKPPQKLIAKIIEKYQLNDKQEISVLNAIELTDGQITVDLSQATQQEKIMWVMFMQLLYGKNLSENKAKDLIGFIRRRAKYGDRRNGA